jgi:hypothetical protein
VLVHGFDVMQHRKERRVTVNKGLRGKEGKGEE